jgi:hypothetical protein
VDAGETVRNPRCSEGLCADAKHQTCNHLEPGPVNNPHPPHEQVSAAGGALGWRPSSLAAAGLEALISEKRAEEKEAKARAEKQPAKRARFDQIKQRLNWVKGSVSDLRSTDGGQPRPSGATTSSTESQDTLGGAAATALAEGARTSVVVEGGQCPKACLLITWCLIG